MKIFIWSVDILIGLFILWVFWKFVTYVILPSGAKQALKDKKMQLKTNKEFNKVERMK